MIDLRTHRRSSSDFPLNMTPLITSTHPTSAPWNIRLYSLPQSVGDGEPGRQALTHTSRGSAGGEDGGMVGKMRLIAFREGALGRFKRIAHCEVEWS